MQSSLKVLAKGYNHEEVEKKWLEKWDDALYYFDKSSKKPRYIIDTPPPYPTGDFHIGNALNWCYIDFIARYKRMRGYNVMFPQGWDCHGLPTEVKVEEKYGITKKEISRAEFRELCKKLTMENIEKMRVTMRRLGMSIDWSNEYITMDDRYKRYTQLSFIKMYKDGWIYREEHPVNWCPRCETAIAFAEVEYEDRDAYLNYILFKRRNGEKEGYVEIATTRPELLASCVAVAVHPGDERYRGIVGEELEVPLFGHKVRVYEDENVDPSFGTGVVMICTFGDRQDVRWWKKHNLPLRVSIDERGRMTEIAGEYAGLSVEECKRRIVEDLRERGLLKRRERIKQSVGVCWRCKTPIEIISTKQWFVRVDKEAILEAARKIKWYPEHFVIRLENWVTSMEWDWCISRQRIFSVPIPVWYCKRCGAVKVAEKDELPVDPLVSKPKGACEECGSYEFEGEKDVLDTWMDSSITAFWVRGFDFDAPTDEKDIPTELRPQGHDIIRTWAFYTILRSLALANRIPWHTIVINGMVLGEDGYKMSKSRNNIIPPEEVIEKYGADAFRQWAAIGGSVGSDVQFRWKDVIAARRFMQKLWSILRFSLLHLSSYEVKKEGIKLRIVDRWLLSKLNKLISAVTEAMDNFKFDEAIKSIRAFAWNVLADNYIELVKGRLYGKGGEEGREAARYVLYEVVKTLSILLAPFTPFLAEEMYSHITGGGKSVHMEKWPEAKPEYEDAKAEEEGDLIAAIVSAVRRYKSDKGMPLNAPLKKIVIISNEQREIETEDIENATAAKVELRMGEWRGEEDKEKDERLEYALKMLQNVSVFLYSVSFEL
ncbi:MAG: valine--tRNA ligase, partial [Candidatus Methanospirareceae archaeon]